jgi:PAS domain S-box-containing protein
MTAGPATGAGSAPSFVTGGTPPRNGRRRALLFALLAALTVFLVEQTVEHFARESAREHERLRVQDELSVIRARLEGIVNANLFLVHGLTAVVASRPDLDQAAFEEIARNLVDERHALRNIGAAPDMVIRLMYPLEGNEAALGLDYMAHPEQRELALRARDTGTAVVAGPLQLKQGGTGFIVREPVFIKPEQPGGVRRFWGLVSAVFDVDALYDRAGLNAPNSGLRLALRGKDGTGAAGPVFYGDARLFEEQPVTKLIFLPSGSWQLAAVPVGGWSGINTQVYLIRLLGLLAALAAAPLAYRLARSAQELKESEARFAATFEQAAVGIAMVSPQGRWLRVNQTLCRITGYTKDELFKLSFQDITHPDDLDADLGFVRCMLDREIDNYAMEKRYFRKDGSLVWVNLTVSLVWTPRGGPDYFISVIEDISDRKRMQDEILQLNADLEERVRLRTADLAAINKELETFTYSVSHDLKAPLRGIDGYSRLLLENHGGRLDEEGRLFLDNVILGVRQMNTLIEDLLAYSRMERRSLRGMAVDLRRAVAQVLEERTTDIQALGMHVDVQLDELTAQADPDGLAMVLRNLVDNALKFTRDVPEPRLTIRGEARGNRVILEIGDNGIGFDMQFHDRIFEIFQRLQRAEDYPGTGIGLAIVRKAMQRMGGGVRAESAPGGGAIFFLELPR